MSEKSIQQVARKLSVLKTNLRSLAEDAHTRLLSQLHKDLLRSSQLVEAKATVESR